MLVRVIKRKNWGWVIIWCSRKLTSCLCIFLNIWVIFGATLIFLVFIWVSDKSTEPEGQTQFCKHSQSRQYFTCLAKVRIRAQGSFNQFGTVRQNRKPTKNPHVLAKSSIISLNKVNILRMNLLCSKCLILCFSFYNFLFAAQKSNLPLSPCYVSHFPFFHPGFAVKIKRKP